MIRADAAIAGGGPAGAALALRLARLGHRVVLVDRRAAIARGFAESLAPGVDVHLQTLGVALPPHQVVTTKLVRWDGETRAVGTPSRIVDRAQFDAHLLRAAADAGVAVLQPASIESFARVDGRWRIRAAGAEIDATFLADATGRAGLLRIPRRNVAPRAFALRARWSGIHTPPELRIERRANGWMWGASHTPGEYDAAVFTEGRAPKLRPASELFAFLDRAPEATQICDATPYVVDQPVGEDWIVVGDAASTIDPLASAGVQKALGTAIAGAATVHSILAAPERTRAAIEFYTSKVCAAATRHAAWAAEHYAGAAEPHRAPMIAPDSPIALHSGARLVEAPVLAGDLIELRRVVETPSGERVAWLGSADVVALLAPLREGMTAAELARSWSLPPADALAAMQWFVANGVLEGMR